MKKIRSSSTKKIPVPPTRSRNTAVNMKKEISCLAIHAKTRMSENNKLSFLISTHRAQITRNKRRIQKFVSADKPRKEDICLDLQTNNDDISNINLHLHRQKVNMEEKYRELMLTMDVNTNKISYELEFLRERNFILKNALIEKDNVIAKLRDCISFSVKNPLVRENKREVKVADPTKNEDDFSEMLDFFQEVLLIKCKSFNKYNRRIPELLAQIDELKREKNVILHGADSINISVKHVKKNCGTKYSRIQLGQSRHNPSSNQTRNSKFRLVQDEPPEVLYKTLDKFSVNNVLNLKRKKAVSRSHFKSVSSCLDDSLLNNSVSSNTEEEENINFPDLVKPKKDIRKAVKNCMKIPELDLKLIVFNKKKLKKEDQEKSLSRAMKNKGSEINNQIKKMREKIKNLKRKIYVKNLKIQLCKDKIAKLADEIKKRENSQCNMIVEEKKPEIYNIEGDMEDNEEYNEEED